MKGGFACKYIISLFMDYVFLVEKQTTNFANLFHLNLVRASMLRFYRGIDI